MDFLTIALLIFVAAIFFFLGKLIATLSFKERERAIRADTAKRSRAVVGGQVSEQLAPFLPDFPFKPSEVKFVGKPVDFIVFEGLDEKAITNVVFLEVKSGKSRLSSVEKTLKETIEHKNVAFAEYRVPDGKT
ncbi:MAG: hypothetical protein OXR66_02910 [Candidatus Woesearchaeota archaeon]|nr:hypothetical protein [Candidatus Woesearchaeota archaeon]